MQQSVVQFGGIALHKPKVNVGELLPVYRENLRQDDTAAGMGEADGQPSGREVFDVGQFPVSLALQGQQLPGPLFERLAGVGQGQRVGAVEQYHVKFFFHIGNVVA